jgi:multidrug resistance efflux pump
MKKALKLLSTGAILLIALLLVLWKYWDYVVHPWTRDGQVRADVVQVTPRVSGPIVRMTVKDNQRVAAGDLLFEIDPRTFEASLAQARARYDQTGDNYLALEKQVEAAQADVEMYRAGVREAESSIRELDSTIERNRAEYQRQQEMLPRKATSPKAVESAKANYDVSLEKRKGAVAALTRAQAALDQARAGLAKAQANLGAQGESNASIREARAEVRQAELNLEFTQVRAPVEGYVTNLNPQLGSHAVANQPALALIDTSSFWVDGFFRETAIAEIRSGDEAIVTLMTYPDQPLKGKVDSIGWGISQQDGSTGFELLPQVSATFEWIRLAQRVPVRILLDEVPDNVALRVGTTASVLVRTGTAENSE